MVFICLILKCTVLMFFSLSCLVNAWVWVDCSYFEKFGALTDAYMPKAKSLTLLMSNGLIGPRLLA
jgi:hypothetical protein